MEEEQITSAYDYPEHGVQAGDELRVYRRPTGGPYRGHDLTVVRTPTGNYALAPGSATEGDVIGVATDVRSPGEKKWRPISD